MKIKAKLKTTGIIGIPLLEREFEIDDEKHNKATDKDLFIRLSFAHLIADELEITYKKVK